IHAPWASTQCPATQTQRPPCGVQWPAIHTNWGPGDGGGFSTWTGGGGVGDWAYAGAIPRGRPSASAAMTAHTRGNIGGPLSPRSPVPTGPGRSHSWSATANQGALTHVKKDLRPLADREAVLDKFRR